MKSKDIDTNVSAFDFAELLETEFLKLYHEYAEGKPESQKPQIIDSIWLDLYELIFKPTKEELIYNRCKSRLLPYNVVDIENVVNTFLKLCYRFHGTIKIQSFLNLVGYDRQTLYNWEKWNNTDSYIFNLTESQLIEDDNVNVIVFNNNSIDVYNHWHLKEGSTKELSLTRFDIMKKIRHNMNSQNTNDLSVSTVGQLAIANNDSDTGKLWDIKRVQAREEVKRIESPSERLKRIGISPEKMKD